LKVTTEVTEKGQGDGRDSRR